MKQAGETLVPLSRMELSIWLGQQRHKDLPLYNMGMMYEIEGEFDFDRFHKAFLKLVNSSDVMRSIVVVKEAIPYIQVLDELLVNIDYLDFSQKADPRSACEKYYQKKCQDLIDISKCNFDVSIAKFSDNLHCWFLNQHHLFTDIASLELIYREVGDNYLDLDRSLSTQGYMDVNRSSNNLASDNKLPHKLEQNTADFDEENRMNLYGVSRSRYKTNAYRIKSSLESSIVANINSMIEMPECRTLSLDLSRFCLISTAIVAFLSRVGDKTSLTIACPTQNRSTPKQKRSLGMYIQVLALRVECFEEDTFTTLYPRVQAAAIEYMRMAASDSGAGSRLRNTSVVWNMIQTQFGDFGGMPSTAHWLDNGHIDSQHDLRIQILNLNKDEDWGLYFDVNCDVFDRSLGEKAVAHFKRFLANMLENRNEKMCNLSLVDSEEAAFLLRRSQRTLTKMSGETAANRNTDTVLSALRNHFNERPLFVAARAGKREILFSELEVESNRLAVELRSMVRSSKVVAICMPRSIELLIAIIAVLKSGSAYVPLDASWPKKRIELVYGLVKADYIITNEEYDLKFNEIECPVISVYFNEYLSIKIDGASLVSKHTFDVSLSLPDLSQEEIAYIIYTSGSTGEPKGVGVNYKSLNSYVSWAAKKYVGVDQTGDFALHSSIGFDLTITSIFVPLWLGATIHIYQGSSEAGDFSVLDAFEDDRAELVKLTPAHLSLIIEMNKPSQCIKTLILGGENLSRNLTIKAKALLGEDVRIFNEYGPTEAVVGCMWHEFDKNRDKGDSVPIGSPVDGAAVYLLDDELNPVPDGVIGEIYIGGDQLANGYLNDTELTLRKFLNDPWCPEKRLYKSGDLARFGLNGEMMYLGRKDHQVKIRGARVEIEEIKSAIMLHEKVTGCHVLAIEGIEKTGGEEVQYCRICGLGSDYPGVEFDSTNKCHVCKDFELYRDRANRYFKDLAEFKQLVSKISRNRKGDYDCLVLLSGGKDSTYALYSIARMGFSIFAMTLDNGYISEEAKINIRRTIEDLQIHHEFVSVARMSEIFSDSLKRHSSVCYGCFKTIYTLSINIASENGIPAIITGLSRGQLFETRLNKVSLVSGAIDSEKIDREVIENRKIYHRIQDKVTEVLDMDLFKDDEIFDQVQFVDFYRYCDISMDEMYHFLEKHAPWTRPKDTGRSTNCLINDTGIYVHKKRMGYHNYALPYSWDVRLGHKERDSALEELNDQIDVSNVKEILKKIDYREPEVDLPANQLRLVAYFTSNSSISRKELQDFVRQIISDAMVPSYFVQLEALPLNTNGKVDDSSLPDPRFQRPELKEALVPPASNTEVLLAEIWQLALRIKKIGVHDNFFELGGDSIIAIQIVANANQRGLKLTPNQVFQYPTVSALSSNVASERDSSDSSEYVPATEAFSLLDDEELSEIASIID